MQSYTFSLATFFLLLSTAAARNIEFGWRAEANHANNTKQADCDPDYGWLPGPDGSNKCYMLVKGYDVS